MHLPIGISDFRELIEYKDPAEEGYLYIDKTTFIKEIIYDLTKVIVLTRPRRFGKTLNLSMLRYFYANEVNGQLTKGLFNVLEISKYADCMQHQGMYPVIFITFKDAKYKTFDLCYEHIKDQITNVYSEYRFLLESDKLAIEDQALFKKTLDGKIDRVHLDASIKVLTKFIHKVTGKQSIVLIDEYDTPIQEAYSNKYYNDLISFMRNLLSSGLKDNSFVKRAILTGILRIAKESLFSSLNNVQVYSVLNKKYSNYFGFTGDEVNNLLTKAKLPIDTNRTKEWYNGYNFDGVTIYNPWSIINFIQENGKLRSYWVNTSGNELIKKLIIESSYGIQERIAELIAGRTIQEYIDEHIVFNDLETNPESIWSLLLMSGYLKYTSCEDKGRRYLCELKLPNNEVEDFYISVVEDWLIGDRGFAWYREFLYNLTSGMVPEFEEKLQTWMEETLSFHDVTKTSQENLYQMLLLGLTAGLKGTHTINSNKESGLGRYDVEITPNDPKQLGIIIELKVTNDPLKLEEKATAALEQIKKLNYAANLKSKGIINICLMGLSCSGKSIKIISSKL